MKSMWCSCIKHHSRRQQKINLLIDGFTTLHRLNRNPRGELGLFVREHIPSKLIEEEVKPFEGFPGELKLRMTCGF